MAAVYAPIGAVIGDWAGSSQGLGYLMLLANGRVKTDLMSLHCHVGTPVNEPIWTYHHSDKTHL